MGEGDWSSPLGSGGENVGGVSVELSSPLGMLMASLVLGLALGLKT